MEDLLLLIVFTPFVASIFLATLGYFPASGKGLWMGRLAVLTPLVCAAGIVYLMVQFPGKSLVVSRAWIPSLGPAAFPGVQLSFLIDGLSLFYGLVVAGMGVLVFIFASAYLTEKYEHRNRFFAYLTAFMGAMLGAVFSNNIILLFTFWELTGLTSFLLIGFLHGDADSRRGARMALVTTATGGLALLAGLVLLSQIGGSLELSRLLETGREAGAKSPGLFTAALILIMAGAFAKSAQFPFHFWLPNAMTAPTPVSAYLHSATMVKLGVFLTARMFPVFAATDLWSPFLITIGFTTMLLGGVFALLSHKLKAILAHSTVAQLGYLIGLYGLSLGDNPLVRFDFVHVLNHVFYKGCLFMVVGIVDHATGIKDIRQLGGLMKRMPMTAFACALAAAAMAGVPPTVGFLSKEMLLTDTLKYASSGGLLGYAPLIALVLVSILKVAFSLRLVLEIFGGKPAPELTAKIESGAVHTPGLVIQLPAFLLALAALFSGIFSKPTGTFQDHLAVAGLTAAAGPLKLWHGFNLELGLSLSAILAGTLLYVFARRVQWRFANIPNFVRFDLLADIVLNGLPRFAGDVTARLRSDEPRQFLPIIAAFTVALGGGMLFYLFGLPDPGGPMLERFWSGLAGVFARESLLGTFIAVLIAVFVLTVTFSHRWIIQLIALAAAGFLVTFYFVLYRAPDLALTQLLVEAVTLILTLLLLARFPKSAQRFRPSRGRERLAKMPRVAIALAFGVMTACVAWLGANYRASTPAWPAEGATAAGAYYIKNTVSLAAGTNAVNTILVDFRGFDTLLEVGVFIIAALGCLGLIMRYQRKKGVVVPPRPKEYNIHARPDERLNSYIYRTIVPFLFFPLVIFSIYLLLRGHNYPGGGFIGGLMTAVCLVLLSFSMGLERFHRVIPVDPMRLSAIGLLIAAVAGLPGAIFGRAFLMQYNFKFKDVPLLGELYLGTPLLFDIGVYMLVVGVSIKVLFVLSKSTSGLSALVNEEERNYAAPGEEPVE